MIELRLGDWRDVLGDVTECDAVVTDPPYSRFTHEGNATLPDQYGRANLGYAALSPRNVREIVDSWVPRCNGWFVAMTDDALSWIWRRCLDRAGMYAFASVSLIQHRPRLVGDGPGSCTIHINTARPREKRFCSWGSLPGWYKDNPVKFKGVNGTKPLRFMRALIRDYTKPGDLIVDPFAGSGTTLIAARQEGRSCIGAELDPETYKKALARIEKPYTPELF